MDPIATARALAARHPQARLPCPICAASVNAANLARHLAKVHGDPATAPPPRWRGKGRLGLLPCTLTLEDDHVILRHALGLGGRTVRLPCALEIGALTRARPDPTMTSYAAQMNIPYETVRAGRYLRLVGERTLTLGARQNTQVARHWDRAGWREGGRRGRVDAMVDVTALLALEYALARLGALVPAPAPG